LFWEKWTDDYNREMIGTGIIKGLVETARNFVGSYRDPERFVTIQYPEEKRSTKENNRNFPFLVFDGDDPEKGLRCVSCKICEKECPPQCIYIVPERDARGKPQKHPKVFDIDVSVCMSCQICVEVCPFDAIKMDQEFELSNANRFAGLLLHKEHLAKSNAYYHKLHPTEAKTVDAQLALERQQQEAKAKAAAAPAAAKPAGPGPAGGAAPAMNIPKIPAPASAKVPGAAAPTSPNRTADSMVANK
jgi:NADH-quinone oxidoreductase subunit I